MPKKAAQPPEPDSEFGFRWEGMPTSGMPPTLMRQLMRRALCCRLGWVSPNKEKAVSIAEHRKAIIRTLWPENVLAYHYWTDRRIESTSEHNFVMWMGGGGIGKTVDAAAIALEYWLEDPTNTAVIVCSTTKDMLRTRIWGQIVRLHNLLPPEAKMGELLDTACFIRIHDGDWLHGVKGIAVMDGSPEEAINNLIGMHANRVMVVLDEAQGVREAIMLAIPNLLKNPESKMLIMGNPSDFNSLLCRYGAPVNGWDSIPRFSEQWETKTWGYKGVGIGLYFDGYKSPGVLDPEWGRKHPWMTSKSQIDAHLEAVGGNENDPGFMVQTRGWPPSKGVEQTLLDMAIVHTFHCQKQPVWTHGKTACAAIDSSFGGADKSVLQFGWRGWCEEEDAKRWVIGYGDTVYVPIDAESDTPIEYQIVHFVKKQCELRGISSTELAVAAGGRAAALVGIFKQEWGPVVAIEEGGTPSERKVGPLHKTAKESYDTRASELGFLLREFALGNGLRGLPEKATEQACKRLTYNMRGKSCMEAKKSSKGRIDEKTGKPVRGFKERLGYSPDEMDACQTLAEHCRLKGAEPGTGQSAPKAREDHAREAREVDEAWGDGSYSADHDWRAEAMLQY